MKGDSKYIKSKSAKFIIAFILIGLIGGIIYLAWPFLSIFSNPEEARSLIIDAGAWGPLIFILMQVVQILIAPIPGQVVGLIGGFLFGPFLGLIYTLIGATIGFTLIFFLSRKLGRPFVERFVDKKFLNKFDHLTKEKGVMVFFFIFLLPAFPDDIISFIAGLTTIKIRTLILISLVGRLPGYVVLSLTGNGMTYENYNPIVVTFITLAIIFSIAWWKRVWLREFVEHSNRSSFLMMHWKNSWKTIVLWIIGMLIVAILLYKAATVVPIQR